MKALVTEKIHDVGLHLLAEHLDLVYAYHMRMDEFVPKCIEENPDAIVIRGIPYQITREIIDGCPNLKAIAANVIDVSNVDKAYCREKNIPIFNVPGGSSEAVAELSFGLLLDVARNISAADRKVRCDGVYNKQLHMGVTLRGKTIGIVALGRVGQAVARFSKAFGMRVTGYDPFLPVERAEALGIELLPLEQLFRASDFITIHTPLTEETRHMIGKPLLDAMKPGAILVNTGRGGVVDEAALYEALKEKRIRGAGIDVFEREAALDNPLFTLDNTVCTPHIGGSAEEAQVYMATSCCTQLLKYLKLI